MHKRQGEQRILAASFWALVKNMKKRREREEPCHICQHYHDVRVLPMWSNIRPFQHLSNSYYPSVMAYLSTLPLEGH